jgi:hypothetical protein
MTTTIRSRKVRRILRLEGEAGRQAAREARATARATRLQRRADSLRAEARAVEASLDGAQRAELARVRTRLAPPAPTPLGPRAWRHAGDRPCGPARYGAAATGAVPEPEET